MNKLDKALVGLFALNAVAIPTLVGKERKPMTGTEAMAVIGVDLLLIGALLKRRNR